jgi:hypothetical protein
VLPIHSHPNPSPARNKTNILNILNDNGDQSPRNPSIQLSQSPRTLITDPSLKDSHHSVAFCGRDRLELNWEPEGLFRGSSVLFVIWVARTSKRAFIVHVILARVSPSLLRWRGVNFVYESMTPCAPTFFLFVVFGRCIDIIQAFCFNSFADFGFVYGSGASS